MKADLHTSNRNADSNQKVDVFRSSSGLPVPNSRLIFGGPHKKLSSFSPETSNDKTRQEPIFMLEKTPWSPGEWGNGRSFVGADAMIADEAILSSQAHTVAAAGDGAGTPPVSIGELV